MPAVDYIYAPIYGVEEYKSVAEGAVGLGGAHETNDNLLVTLWQLTNDVPFAVSSLVVPNYANDNETTDQLEAYKQGMRSRSSARIFLNTSGSNPKVDSLFAVLDPPWELKQQLRYAVERVGDAGDPFASLYKIKKPLQGCYAWRVLGMNASFVDGENNFLSLNAAARLEGLYSEYLPLPRGVSSSSIPFLKTSGSDGNAPVGFDLSTNDGIDELIDAVDAGSFWVGMELVADFLSDGNPGQINIEWPHSAARS